MRTACPPKQNRAACINGPSNRQYAHPPPGEQAQASSHADHLGGAHRLLYIEGHPGLWGSADAACPATPRFPDPVVIGTIWR